MFIVLNFYYYLNNFSVFMIEKLRYNKFWIWIFNDIVIKKWLFFINIYVFKIEMYYKNDWNGCIK